MCFMDISYVVYAIRVCIPAVPVSYVRALMIIDSEGRPVSFLDRTVGDKQGWLASHNENVH